MKLETKTPPVKFLGIFSSIGLKHVKLGSFMKEINNMAAYENFDQHEIDAQFNQFWNSVKNDFINSRQFKKHENFQSTNSKQLANYRRYAKDGVELALESLETTSLQTLFPDMESIPQWNFTDSDFKSLNFSGNLTDSDFKSLTFSGDLSMFRGITQRFGESLNRMLYGGFMTELYNKFHKSIDENPQTQRNFDGSVDESVIRDLCLGFKKSIEELAKKHNIGRLKPRFFVICVAFASYKMLLPRLAETLELEMTKDYYKKLYVLKLRGAQKSQL